MRALLIDDPLLETGHFIMLAPLFTIGKALIEYDKKVNETSLVQKDAVTTDRKVIVDAVTVCWECIDGLGNNFGLQARKAAGLFHQMMVAAQLADLEVVPAPKADEVIEVADDEPKERKALFFASSVEAAHVESLSRRVSVSSLAQPLARSGSQSI
jgi:hypothetical protein